MSGIVSSWARRSKLQQVRSRMAPLVLPLTAVAAALFLPALHADRVHALPTSVAKTVAQVQLQPQSFPVFSAPASAAEASARRMLEDRVRSLGQSFNGHVGIAVKDLQTGFTTHYRGNDHYPQQSVSKFWVTLTALQKADRGELDIFAPVTVTKADLTLFNQPIAAQIGPNGYRTTLAELMQRAMQQSDNTCNDFVLWRAGGPDAVRDFLQRNGIDGIRFGPGERKLQSAIAGMEWRPSMVGAGFYAARNALPASVRKAAFDRYVADPMDGATPLGIVDALGKLKTGELLSPGTTRRLLDIMSHTKTGPQRLKGGLQPGWTLAHKTGTGQVYGGVQAGYNDIGVITGPDGRSYSLAVMIGRTTVPLPTRMALMQNVVRAAIDYSRNMPGYDVARGSDPRASGDSASN